MYCVRNDTALHIYGVLSARCCNYLKGVPKEDEKETFIVGSDGQHSLACFSVFLCDR